MMRKIARATKILAFILAVPAVGMAIVARAQQAPQVTRKVLLQQDLAIPDYQAALVSVEIPVGGREGRHTHPGGLIVYVLEGTITLDHEGKPSATYKPGDSFFVEAGKIHEGINQGSAPIKALATLVVPKGKPLTAPAQ
jgi:quercetin dioxygenase-like cupin family protein